MILRARGGNSTSSWPQFGAFCNAAAAPHWVRSSTVPAHQQGARLLYTDIPLTTPTALDLYQTLVGARVGFQVVFSPPAYARHVSGSTAYQIDLSADTRRHARVVRGQPGNSGRNTIGDAVPGTGGLSLALRIAAAVDRSAHANRFSALARRQRCSGIRVTRSPIGRGANRFGIRSRARRADRRARRAYSGHRGADGAPAAVDALALRQLAARAAGAPRDR